MPVLAHDGTDDLDKERPFVALACSRRFTAFGREMVDAACGPLRGGVVASVSSHAAFTSPSAPGTVKGRDRAGFFLQRGHARAGFFEPFENFKAVGIALFERTRG